MPPAVLTDAQSLSVPGADGHRAAAALRGKALSLTRGEFGNARKIS